jgi:four helix bundle protein
MLPAPWTVMVAKHYWELDAWQAVRAFKEGIYGLIEREPLANDLKLRDQLRESAASAQSHIAEGFGRFDPLDNARFVKMARASMLECHNHLGDAVDRKRITEETRREHLVRWEDAMKKVGGWLDYLQSPEAKRNADRIRQQRTERRRQRKQGTANPEP